MRRSPRPALVFVLSIVLPVLALAGFPGTDVVIPVVARIQGLGDPPAQYYATVWLTNRSSEAAAAVQLQFYERGARTNPVASASLNLLPGETRRVDNCVETLFGLTGAAGSLRILSDAAVLAATRVYDLPPGGSEKDTTGVSFAGVPAAFAVGRGEPTVLQGVAQTAETRYNFGVVETAGQAVTVTATVKDRLGAVIGSHAYALPAHGQMQANVTDVTQGAVGHDDAVLELEVTAGAGRILAYGTGNADVSQDPTGFEMALRADALAAGVQSLNTLQGDVTLAAGPNVTITSEPGASAASGTGSAGTITIAAATEPGPTGPAGPQGETGAAGPSGPTGPRGLRGATGPTGPEGAAGATGAEGAAGPAGPQGPAGATGPQGVAGATGAIGPQGVAGATGAAGPQGATGIAGPQGIVGPTGAAGPQGEAGATGPQGLQGVAGPAGATGPQGPQGDLGATGAQGPQGLAGPAGVTGPQGPQGDAGATGAQGPQGLAGPAGATGPQGLQGLQGLQGPAGPSGPTGATGPAGAGLTGVGTGTMTAAEGQDVGTCVIGQVFLCAGVVCPGLKANGQALVVTAHQALFALIGYTYGGSGATFNLPNLTALAPNHMTYTICDQGSFPTRN